jgi:hypothetical protein
VKSQNILIFILVQCALVCGKRGKIKRLIIVTVSTCSFYVLGPHHPNSQMRLKREVDEHLKHDNE